MNISYKKKKKSWMKTGIEKLRQTICHYFSSRIISEVYLEWHTSTWIHIAVEYKYFSAETDKKVCRYASSFLAWETNFCASQYWTREIKNGLRRRSMYASLECRLHFVFPLTLRSYPLMYIWYSRYTRYLNVTVQFEMSSVSCPYHISLGKFNRS